MIDELRLKYPLSKLLKISGIKKTTYYYNKYKEGKDYKNREIIDKIESIYFENSRRYGYRRITDELHNQGININHKKVKRLMSNLNLYGIRNKRVRYNSYKGTIGKVANNILKRDFNADLPNYKWTTDVTEFGCIFGKAYLSPIIDMFNGEVVSYSVSYCPDFKQIDTMLNRAFNKYPSLNGCIMHSDQGWQYQNPRYQKALKDHGIIQSMSRKGNCLDNAVAESFFSVLKREMFYGHESEFKSFNEIKKAIDDYIDYYNNVRIKHELGGLSPIQYRQKMIGL